MIAWLSRRERTEGIGTIAGLTRYRQLRQAGLELNNRLIETLPRDVLDEGAQKLGLLRKNTILLESEDEIAVLMDYCLHDVRRQGMTAIDRYLQTSPPPADSDEMILLQALRESRFSVYAVETTEPGVGVQVRDMLRDEPLFLTDVGLSRTAPRGLILATRVMVPDGIAMTTGAALPIGVLPAVERERFLSRFAALPLHSNSEPLSPAQATELSTTLIRAARERGASSQVTYETPGSAPFPARARESSRPAPARTRIGRNDPCPCGSGQKFKRCCKARG